MHGMTEKKMLRYMKFTINVQLR